LYNKNNNADNKQSTAQRVKGKTILVAVE